MMLIFLIFGFVYGASSCSDQEFQCGSGKCINFIKHCDGYPDCLDNSDEVAGCGAECILNDLKKFLHKDETVKTLYQSGEKINISCPLDDDDSYIYGYEYDETSELTCINGIWDGYIPKCVVNCQLNALSQYLTKNQPTEKSYRHGQKISIKCVQSDSNEPEYDYHQYSEDSPVELTCHNGQWIGYYPECFTSCLPIVLKDFLIEEQDAMKEYRSGERISVSCSRNLQGSQAEENLWNYAFDDEANADQARNLTCLNGRWFGEYPECFERCRRSSIQGNLVAEPESEYLLPGDVVKIQICWGNIPVEGDGHLICMANGSWYGKATCPPQSASDCFTPWEVQNAYISGKRWNRYPEGAVITYKCAQAFLLRGNNKLTCINGTWTEKQFYCIIRTCLYHGEIENGNVLNTSVEVGQYVHFRCDDGYILKGPHMMLCYADGKFHSEMMPKCLGPVCEISPLVLRYGRFHRVDGMTIDHGDRVSIRKIVKCDYGYTVPPNISYVSCYKGTLYPPNFDCIKYDYSIRQCHLSTTVGQVIRYRDKCYLATHGAFISYYAMRFCQNLGPTAHLAMIPDKETNEAIGYLMNMTPGEKKYWFGAMWNSHNFRWEWPNGKGLNYTNWMSGEGSKTVTILNFKPCAVVTSDLRWATTFCWNVQKHKAICEMAAN